MTEHPDPPDSAASAEPPAGPRPVEAAPCGARPRHVPPRTELLYAQAVKLVGLGAWSIDLATGQLWWSDEVFRIHDLPVGNPPAVADAIAYYTPEARKAVEGGLQHLIETGRPYDVELPLVTATGRAIWTRSLGNAEYDEQGRPVRLYGVFQDITAQRLANDALRRSEQRMWLALRGNEDGVWDWNLAEGTVYFSERWKEILGFAEHELANDFDVWQTRLHPEDLPATMRHVDEVVRGVRDVYRVQFRMLHKSGTWRWILARAKVFARDVSGRATRLVGTHTDITEQVETQQALVRAKAEAESAARAKAEFLATMSHEIRTPMNGVLGMAQILDATQLDPDQRRMVETIQASGASLLVILNDILDLSKIEAGRLELEVIPFDLAELLCEVQRLLAMQATARGLELSVEYDERLPRFLLGDPLRLRQIVVNLVANALKFTERGSVRVRARAVAPGSSSEAQRDVLIEVIDTGIGISAEQRQRLFDAFSQGDRSTTRRFGGTGLGLAICRRLCELMGGAIEVVSEVGQGSTFSIRLGLPVAERDHEAPTLSEVPAPLPSVAGARVRVLLVEDNPVNQLVARRMLEQLGCDVEVAADGRDGLEHARRGGFAAIFMDCQMPVMDGLEATRRLRAHEVQRALARTPVVALTANAFEEDRQACLAAGMDDHVPKPIERAALRRCLERWALRSLRGSLLAHDLRPPSLDVPHVDQPRA